MGYIGWQNVLTGLPGDASRSVLRFSPSGLAGEQTFEEVSDPTKRCIANFTAQSELLERGGLVIQ